MEKNISVTEGLKKCQLPSASMKLSSEGILVMFYIMSWLLAWVSDGAVKKKQKND